MQHRHVRRVPRRRSRRILRVAAVGACLAALLGAAALPAGATRTPPPQPAPPTFTVRASVNQVAVLDAPPGATVELRRNPGRRRAGRLVATGTVDQLGSFLFRNVDARDDYAVSVVRPGAPTERADDIAVRDADWLPPQSHYDSQTLPTSNLASTRGYGYLRTRDGTTLSTQVVLPGPADQGPYPTIVEYSGYDPSSPTTGQPQYSLLGPALGYAWVGVNIRGTGCSGGAFSYFETLQALDGYDVIETVAAQPWSDKVGMVGISYAGNSQLFVAKTNPPHLAAITPLSIVADTYRSTLYPGGIKNDGFALGWARERVEQNRWPNPNAPRWVVDRIAAGDAECAANMKLRGQNLDLLAEIEKNTFYDTQDRYDFPNGADALSPVAFAGDIRTPTFLAGAWQDEQTGGDWANVIAEFDPQTPLRVIGQNGVHTEALDPVPLAALIEFLDIYVAERVPSIPPIVRFIAPLLWQEITGVGGLTLPPDRFTDAATFAEAKARYESEPPIRILWETGAAPGATPGAPLPAAESTYERWPIEEVTPVAWHFQPDGSLDASDPPRRGGSSSYSFDPTSRPRTNWTGSSGGIWRADARYTWAPTNDTTSVSFVTDPLTEPVAMAGTGSVDLWIRADIADTDLQVTISEVRPDGQERYVQNGWLRASHRRLDRSESTDLRPVVTHSERHARPLPIGRFEPVRIALFPFAHVFRAGSQIRITVQAPGGDRALWTFATYPAGGTIDVAHEARRPSRVVLPVLQDVPTGLPAPLPPCESVRAQPCRAAPS